MRTVVHLSDLHFGRTDDTLLDPLVSTIRALAPDVMPHWAGGIVDWGEKRVKLPTGNEVGHLYPAFLVDLCRWLISTS